MEKSWTKIFSSPNLQKTELIKSLLAHNGIQSIIVNQQDSFYRFGDIELFVNRNDVIKATFVLKKNNIE